MPAIITEKFRQSNATAFSNDISTSKYYMFIGKSQTWESEGSSSDTQPPAPVDSVAPESYYWDDMLASKLISSKSFVIPRRDWSATSTFDMYRHDVSSSATSSSGATNLYDSSFYFKTSTHNVYKVLFNGDNAQTGASAIGGTEPTGTGPAPFFHTGTGYFLKYMYTMSASDVQNFLTTDFMPVKVNANPADSNNIRGVFVFLVTSGGSYANVPDGTYYTKLKGDGSGAIARLVVQSNTITSFGSTTSQMQNFGSGYSFASFDLSGSNIFSNITATTPIDDSAGVLTAWNNGTAASITPIIDPAGSHGSNDVEELGGHFVMLQAKFEPADADATQVNDFRRVGIVKNPEVSGGGSAFTASTARNTNAVLLATGSGNYQVDEVITQNGTNASGRVVEWDSANKILYYVQEKYATYGLDTNSNLTLFSGTGTIQGGTSSVTYTPSSSSSTVNNVVFSSGYANPEMKRDTGEIIYVENRRPISRASDQTEDIKVVVEF